MIGNSSYILSQVRVTEILQDMENTPILVVGDLILDRYIWGSVNRISPEAPVPIVRYGKETSVPGGAANVARNLAELETPTSVIGAVGCDRSGTKLKHLLDREDVQTKGILEVLDYQTATKTRILASRQQLLRLDHEERLHLSPAVFEQIKTLIVKELPKVKAVVVGDYDKGFVTQELLDFLKVQCQNQHIWLSVDPKPSHSIDLKGVSLITPNRKEAFQLAGLPDTGNGLYAPLEDVGLLKVAKKLLSQYTSTNILITLGEHGMLLCQSGRSPVHIPTVACEVFDVSGAGDTVIATLTAAVAAGAELTEAAVLANYAAGVVVAKVGTATASPDEILQNLADD